MTNDEQIARETDMRLRDRAREHYGDQAKIALYPELVAACQAALDVADGKGEPTLGWQAIDKLRAVLAKCNGGAA